MAMGRHSRDTAERAIQCCRPFTNSTGSLRGTRGPTRDLGWLDRHPEKLYIRKLLSLAEYVVWSYGTPIGFVAEDWDGEVRKFYVDEHHTVTTSHHQGILKSSWSEYEVIGEGPLSRSRPGRSVVQGSGPVISGARMSFRGQDDLMDEVHGYVHPAHP